MPRKKSTESVAPGAMELADDNGVFKDPIFVKNPALERLPPDHPSVAVTKDVLIDGQSITKGAIPRDPLKLKLRLYIQVGEMLHALETGQGDEGPITMRERIAALTAIGRLQNLLVDKAKDDDENAGSAIRKYAGAFKTNGAGRRNKATRSPARDDLLLESDSGGGDGLDADSDSDSDDLDAAE